MLKSKLAVLALAMLMVEMAACYELVPVRGASPALGTRIALDVNDAGRVALGSSMGPSIDRVEGTLIEQTNGDYLLGVTSVGLLRGGVQTWKGEHVVLKPEFVSGVYERRLDPIRTGLAAAMVGGAVAYIVSRNLNASGEKTENEPPIDSIAQRRSPTIRVPLLSIRLSKLPFLGRP
jgi:hypothetical protein